MLARHGGFGTFGTRHLTVKLGASWESTHVAIRHSRAGGNDGGRFRGERCEPNALALGVLRENGAMKGPWLAPSAQQHH